MTPRSVSLLFAFLFIAYLFPYPSHAHGDHSPKQALEELKKTDAAPAAKEPDSLDPMYAVEEEIPMESETSTSGSGLLGLDNGSPDLGLSPMDMGGMQHDSGNMDNSGKHADHEMPKVEVSSHEWVSSSRKGYRAALGITLLVGLGFVALTVVRPNE